MVLFMKKLCQQIFYKIQNGKLIIVLAKIVDDSIITSDDIGTNTFLEDFNACFELGSIVSGPVNVRFLPQYISKRRIFN